MKALFMRSALLGGAGEHVPGIQVVQQVLARPSLQKVPVLERTAIRALALAQQCVTYQNQNINSSAQKWEPTAGPGAPGAPISPSLPGAP